MRRKNLSDHNHFDTLIVILSKAVLEMCAELRVRPQSRLFTCRTGARILLTEVFGDNNGKLICGARTRQVRCVRRKAGEPPVLLPIGKVIEVSN